MGTQETVGAADRSALPSTVTTRPAKADATKLLATLGFDAADIGALSDSRRSEPGTPVYVPPYMARRPEGLGEEDVQRWCFGTRGVPVSAARVKELIGTAVRGSAGGTRAAMSESRICPFVPMPPSRASQ